MNSLLKQVAVVVCASAVTALAIMASDVSLGLRGSQSGAVGSALGPCATGETLFVFQGRTLCVDTYEASGSSACAYASPTTIIETAENIRASACTAVSAPNVVPWQFISHTEAAQMCARMGKRLLTNDEWYAVASGLVSIDETCILRAQAAAIPTGSSACISPAGVHDLVGNVWEWLDEDVTDGVWDGRTLPDMGYVISVDSNGVVTETRAEPSDSLEADFFWVNQEGVRGMLRGGSYSNGTDGGLYAINASVPLSFRSVGVGFRCVRDIY